MFWPVLPRFNVPASVPAPAVREPFVTRLPSPLMVRLSVPLRWTLNWPAPPVATLTTKLGSVAVSGRLTRRFLPLLVLMSAGVVLLS